MSEFKDFVESEISESVIRVELRTMAEKAIRLKRATEILDETIGVVERKDRSCRSVIMVAADWWVLRTWAWSRFNIETKVARLKDGIMAQYCGIDIRVQRGFPKMVGVPVIDAAEGCMMVFFEEAVE